MSIIETESLKFRRAIDDVLATYGAAPATGNEILHAASMRYSPKYAATNIMQMRQPPAAQGGGPGHARNSGKDL